MLAPVIFKKKEGEMSRVWIGSLILVILWTFIKSFLSFPLSDEVFISVIAATLFFVIQILREEERRAQEAYVLSKGRMGKLVFWLSLQWMPLQFSAWLVLVVLTASLFPVASNLLVGLALSVLNLGVSAVVVIYLFKVFDFVLKRFGIHRWSWGSPG